MFFIVNDFKSTKSNNTTKKKKRFLFLHLKTKKKYLVYVSPSGKLHLGYLAMIMALVTKICHTETTIIHFIK